MKRVMQVFLGFVAVAFSATYSFAQQANIQNLSDNIYSVFLMGYHSMVVVGDTEVLISDPANPYRAEVLAKEIAKITDKPVGKIFLSHEHFDHTGGTEVFSGAKIIAQENISVLHKHDPLDLFPDKVDQTFSDQLEIPMGTTTVRLMYFGAADGVANSVMYFPAEKIAMTTDLYLDGALTPGKYLTDTNLLGNRLVLNELSKMNLKHAVNSHSVTTDPVHLVNTAGFLNDLYDVISPEIKETLKSNPGGLFDKVNELTKTVKMPKYESWGNYADLPEYVRKMSLAIIHGG